MPVVVVVLGTAVVDIRAVGAEDILAAEVEDKPAALELHTAAVVVDRRALAGQNSVLVVHHRAAGDVVHSLPEQDILLGVEHHRAAAGEEEHHMERVAAHHTESGDMSRSSSAEVAENLIDVNNLS